MKRDVGRSVAGIACAVIAVLIHICALAADADALKINEIISKVDRPGVTRAEIVSYFSRIEGENARGEGRVVLVLPDLGNRLKIRILAAASEPAKGYNVLLYAPGEAELNKGDWISFEGKIMRMNPYMGVNIDVRGTFKKTPVCEQEY